MRIRLSSEGPFLTAVAPGDILVWNGVEWLPQQLPAPIQNVRFFDPAFVGTADGSIGKPYAELAPFFGEIAGSNEGWQLNLPAQMGIATGVAVPDIGTGGLVLQGVSPTMTEFGAPWEIDVQTGFPSMEFRDVQLTGLLIAGGGMSLRFTSCFVNNVSVAGAFEAIIDLLDCAAGSLIFPTVDVTLRMHGGTLNGAQFTTGTFNDVTFVVNSSLTPGSGTTTFIGCTFATGIIISNANAPTLVMDTYTHASFLASGVTFAGTVRVLGAIGFSATWGTVVAPATPAARFIPRTNGAVTTTTPSCEYPVLLTGTFSWEVTWRVSGTPLVTDSVAVTIMKSNVATALVSTILPSTVSGKASAIFAANFGDGIAVRLLQSAAEVVAVWNGNFAVRATLIG